MEHTSTASVEATNKPARLTLEIARKEFGRTLGPDGKPDLKHLYKYYRADARFQDSIQVTHGRDAFVSLCNRLARRCSALRMDIHNAAQDGNIIFLHWTMTLSYVGTPSTPLYGTTLLTLDEDGQVVDHRDHYDLWGDTFDVIPGVGKLYRVLMKKFLG